jgi:hypothetical protein
MRAYPTISPRDATGRSETTSAIWYALMIQIASAASTRNSRAIVGSATLATEVSSTAMAIASATTATDQ